MSSPLSRLVSRHALASGCRRLPLAWFVICLLLTGCGAEKESLFEDDHHLPAHWPSNLSDAADKIEQRLELLTNQGTASDEPDASTVMDAAESELRDLVEWIPEVAADTDLSEAQWLPIYEMCEVMREHLSRGDVKALDIEEDFHRLQALLVESARALPTSTDTPSADDAASDDVEASESPESEDSQAEVNSGDPS